MITEAERKSGFMLLTHDRLKAGGNPSGTGYSWNAKQLAVLGVKWPPKKGWKRKLAGRIVSVELYEEFARLKTVRQIPLANVDSQP